MSGRAFLQILGLGTATLILWAAIWSGANWISAQVGGWASLGKSYRTTEAAPPGLRTGQTFFMGIVGYSFVGAAGADARGLYLAVPKIFRVGQPPVLIPWSDIEVEPWDTVAAGYTLRFKEAPRVRLRVFKGLAQALAGDSDGHLELTGATTP